MDAQSFGDALTLSSPEYRRKYCPRRTRAHVECDVVDLLPFYNALQKPGVSYATFRSRVQSVGGRALLDRNALSAAAMLKQADWQTHYGGGRRRAFIYEGEIFQGLQGREFLSVTSFLKAVGRYHQREVVWNRLRRGWAMDDALEVPVHVGTGKGRVYLVLQLSTGLKYVGLTTLDIRQRWAMHCSRARAGSSTKLAQAIRLDGPEGFTVVVLEDGLSSPEELRARERHWVEALAARGPGGLNTAPAGGLGGSRGKPFEFGGEVFPSKKLAARCLGEVHGLAPHVVEARLTSGRPLPSSARVHSRHPDAGTKLFRVWKGILKRCSASVDEAWGASYEQFKTDVSPVPPGRALFRIDSRLPWGPLNWQWIDKRAGVESVHGCPVQIDGRQYPSWTSAAKAFHMAPSTLKYRVLRLGLTPSEAVRDKTSAPSL
ncbi:GIY-YIG nuclease family protein [Pelomonas sp. V22]|nr:GIY-YIG nuclease family protein [Pelomonas sp. V22]